MPMMRRGPLDRYTPEWVLRQANAHQVEGSIEFNTGTPVTLFLSGGRVYAAERGVDLLEADLVSRPLLTETRAREKAITLLAEIMGSTTGWYFHDPLGQHPRLGSVPWETATLLMDIRARVHETSSLADWTGRSVALKESPASSVTLGADAWAVVVALAAATDVATLRSQLGWSPDRLVGALIEIEDRGALDPAPVWRPPPSAPAGSGTLPQPPRPSHHPAPSDGHHTGPLAPPPAVDPGTASAVRRRMLPSRRTTGT
jgi:hypothetical protein